MQVCRPWASRSIREKEQLLTNKKFNSMKNYIISFEDKKHNELFTKGVTVKNIAEARKFAARWFAELCDNDATHYHVKRA